MLYCLHIALIHLSGAASGQLVHIVQSYSIRSLALQNVMQSSADTALVRYQHHQAFACQLPSNLPSGV